jgi:predicted alpha/beta hydrolase family esterase
MDATTPSTTSALTLPGWMGSGPSHWQSLWEVRHGDRRVEQDDWELPVREEWTARLDEALRSETSPAVLVAHSLGCHLVAAWAATADDPRRVRAALLVAPPDIGRHDMPPVLHGWRRIPGGALPFPSLLVASGDDPYCALAAARAMAEAWGAELVDAGARGHMNAESGLGDWPHGRDLLARLIDRGE